MCLFKRINYGDGVFWSGGAGMLGGVLSSGLSGHKYRVWRTVDTTPHRVARSNSHWFRNRANFPCPSTMQIGVLVAGHGLEYRGQGELSFVGASSVDVSSESASSESMSCFLAITGASARKAINTVVIAGLSSICCLFFGELLFLWRDGVGRCLGARMRRSK